MTSLTTSQHTASPPVRLIENHQTGWAQELIVAEPAPAPQAIQTTVVIPVFNEALALPTVLEAILDVIDESYEVIVVDDGSSDATVLVASGYPCRVVAHKVNSGKGAAMRTGVQHARGEHIIFIDGDATYPATAIPQIALQLQEYDFVRGIRSLGRDNIPLLNRVGNEIFDRVIKTVHQVDGLDVLTGLYGLRRQHLMAMRLQSDGFDIESEIMIKARGMELRTQGIEIEYNERIGEKKLNPLRDGLKILGRILSMALMFNPFITYILPGMALWCIAIVVVGTLLGGPVITPFGGLSVHSLIVAAMALLAGFQLIMFGCMVNLYTSETGLGRPNNALRLIAARAPRLGMAFFAGSLILGGSVWALNMAWSWVGQGYGGFHQTEELVVSLAFVVWGIQLMSTTLFLSLFANSRKYASPVATVQANDKVKTTSNDRISPVTDELERAVGG